MRTFADTSFFRLFDGLLGEARPDLRSTAWSHRGVDWIRERHTFNGRGAGFAIDQHVITRSGRDGWSLLIVRESWWDGHDKPLRSTQWAKPLSGSRASLLRWLREEERRLAARTRPSASLP